MLKVCPHPEQLILFRGYGNTHKLAHSKLLKYTGRAETSLLFDVGMQMLDTFLCCILLSFTAVKIVSSALIEN